MLIISNNRLLVEVKQEENIIKNIIKKIENILANKFKSTSKLSDF